MASRKLLLLLVLIICLAPCLQARKLLAEERKPGFSLDWSSFMGSLPKGDVPPSAPSKKGHSMLVDEKLLAGHSAKIDRILKSVPSPGVGH